MMDSSTGIQIETRNQDHLGIIRFNHPEKANALTLTMLETAYKACLNFEQHPDIFAIAWTGNATHFSSGVHLDSFKTKETAQKARSILSELLAYITQCETLHISLIHGPAYGGANGLIAACDWAIATPNATFCCPEFKSGIHTHAIAPYLADAMGRRQALSFCLSGAPIDAVTAQRMGLLHKIDKTPINCVLKQDLNYWSAACLHKKNTQKKQAVTENR